MIDYINPFFNQNHTEDTLLKGIDSILNSYTHLKVYSFPTYIDPLYLRKLKNGNDDFRLISENEGIYLFELPLDVKESNKKNEKREIDKLFIVKNHQYDDIYTIICLGYSRLLLNKILYALVKHIQR